jgi:hypothetical protein
MATTDNKFSTTMGRRGGSIGFVHAIPKDDNSASTCAPPTSCEKRFTNYTIVENLLVN